jgi:hypothetical protein
MNKVNEVGRMICPADDIPDHPVERSPEVAEDG